MEPAVSAGSTGVDGGFGGETAGTAVSRVGLEMKMNNSAKRGAILLETLIVLPVYLILIGGIMWIGDLMLAKQQTIIADRYGAWNLGNMHRGSAGPLGNELQDNFFPASAHPHQKAFLFPPKAIPWVRWWDAAYSTVFLQMKMPEWTKGWYSSASKVHLGENVPEVLGIQGRDAAGGKNHVVIMRTDRGKDDSFPGSYPRNWSAKDLAGILRPWSWLVYNEPWPMDMRMMLPITSMAGEEYTRYAPYVAVSE